MSVDFYDELPHRLGLGDIDVLADDLRLALCDATYTFDTSHENVSDLTGIIGTSAADLDGKAWTEDDNGSYLAADPCTVPFVDSGHSVTQAVLYRNGATNSASYLIARIAGSAFPIATSGANITITFSGGRVFSINREGTATVPLAEDELRDVAATLTAAFAVNAQRISNVGAPSADTDGDTLGARAGAAGKLVVAASGVITGAACPASSKVHLDWDVHIRKGDGTQYKCTVSVQGTTDGSSLTLPSGDLMALSAAQATVGVELPAGTVTGGSPAFTFAFTNAGLAPVLTIVATSGTITSAHAVLRNLSL